MRLWLLLALGVASSACGGSQRPAERRVPMALRVSAPPGCELALAQAVEERVDGVAFVPADDASVQLEVEVRATATGLVGQIRTRTGSELLGNRPFEFQQTRCGDIIDPLSFILALVVETPAVQEAARQPPRSRSVHLGVAARGEIGRSPRIAGGGGAFLTLETPRFLPVRLALRGLWPRTEALDTRRVRTGALEAEVGLCPTLERGHFRLAFCGAVDVGLVWASGEDFDLNRSSRAPTVGVSMALRPRWHLGRVALGMGVGGGVALLRPRFVFEDDDGSQVPLRTPGLFHLALALTLSVDL